MTLATRGNPMKYKKRGQSERRKDQGLKRLRQH